MKNIIKALIVSAALLPAAASADGIVGGEDHCYHIVWHNNTSSYLTETGSGELQVEDKSNIARQYWQFIPTDNANCYYIRNAVTGHYIEACRTQQDNTYSIATQTDPVEYYVCPEVQRDGAYRLTSTNCSNYADTSKTPVGLNKNGANSSIITWSAGASNTGSYWDILPTEFDYDEAGAAEVGQHTAYAKSAQVYFMPCGSHYSSYLVRKLQLGGSVAKTLDYPCATWGGSTKKNGTAVTNTWWTIYTTDKAQVIPGRTFTVNITLGKALPEGYLAQLCFDWDRDGVFEDVKSIDNPLAKTLDFEATVPADARLGQSRMRFRLTDNGIDDPDGDVTAGQILDCVIETVAATGALSPDDVLLSVNDPARGTATAEFTDGAEATSVTAKALPLGNARFLCWLEGRKVVSTLATYTFDLTRPVQLKAMFSANTQQPVEAINTPTVDTTDHPYASPLYYDLSGRRVEQPVRGETYIRKDSDQKGTIVIF